MSLLGKYRCFVLYGSQTGCAAEEAARISRELSRRKIKNELESIGTSNKGVEILLQKMENKSNNSEEDYVFIFVISTWGQGSVPDPMKLFWKKILRKNINKNSLNGIKIAVFGLGDSCYYNTFNFAGKKLQRRLLNLGAHELIERGDGDDQHISGVDGSLVPWMENLFISLMDLFHIPNLPLPPPSLPPSCHSISLSSSTSSSGLNDYSRVHSSLFPMFPATVSFNKRITSLDWSQDVRHIVFSIEDSHNLFSFLPGDAVRIYPVVDLTDVMQFIQVMGWSPDFSITEIVSQAPTIPPLPSFLQFPMSLPTFLSHLDLKGVPRRYFFEQLALMATDPEEKEKLTEFASTEGQEQMRMYCRAEMRSYIEVLREFPSARFQPNFVLDVIPPITPRAYSICCSPSRRNVIELTVNVLCFKTPLGRNYRGFCSSWLAALRSTERLYLEIYQGTLRLPKSLRKPIIMVGPGTGCAVFRSFIQQLSAFEGNIAEVAFFFGCRHKSKDYLHGPEWEEYQQTSLLSLYRVAFSRDQPFKIYVWHQIEENSCDVWRYLNSGASIYVSGSAKDMPRDVKDSFLKVIEKEGNFSHDDAVTFIQTLERTHRYHEETWL